MDVLKSPITLLLLAGAAVYIWWLAERVKSTGLGKENYGEMKNIRQIPFNDCRRICETYHSKCVSDFIDADPTWCDRRLEACTAECYYTPYHQLPG